jgi:recombination protein RecT
MTSESRDQTEVIIATLQQPKMMQVIAGSLPAHVPMQKFMAAAISAFRTTDPRVFQDCDKNSIYNAVAQAARAGLLVDGRHGALVPFRSRGQKKCQFLIMPQGIIDSFARARITCYAASVYDADKIRFWDDEQGQHVAHDFDPFKERGKRIGAFAAARSMDGRTWVEAMGMTELERVKNVSKQRDDRGNLIGPWVDWEERMEQKSCLHRLARRVPSVDVTEDEEFREESVVRVVESPERQKTLHSLLSTVSPGASPVPSQEQRSAAAESPGEASKPE